MIIDKKTLPPTPAGDYNKFIKKLSIQEINDISKQVLEARKLQFLSKIGSITLEEYIPDKIIKVRENFIFEIMKLMGLNSISQKIINKFPFGELLNQVRFNDWNKNDNVKKATLFYHFLEELQLTNKKEKDLVRESIVKAFGEDPFIFNLKYIYDSSVKELPPLGIDNDGVVMGEIVQPIQIPPVVPQGINPALFEEKVEDFPSSESLIEQFEKSLKSLEKPSTRGEISDYMMNNERLKNLKISKKASRLGKNKINSFYDFIQTKRTDEELVSELNKLARGHRGRGLVGIREIQNIVELSKNELVDKLATLIGSKVSGNDNVKDDILNVLNVLKKKKYITQEEFRKFLKI